MDKDKNLDLFRPMYHETVLGLCIEYSRHFRLAKFALWKIYALFHWLSEIVRWNQNQENSNLCCEFISSVNLDWSQFYYPKAPEFVEYGIL